MIEVGELRFLADERTATYLDGLQIDVEEYFGREGLVAYSERFGGCY